MHVPYSPYRGKYNTTNDCFIFTWTWTAAPSRGAAFEHFLLTAYLGEVSNNPGSYDGYTPFNSLMSEVTSGTYTRTATKLICSPAPKLKLGTSRLNVYMGLHTGSIVCDP